MAAQHRGSESLLAADFQNFHSCIEEDVEVTARWNAMRRVAICAVVVLAVGFVGIGVYENQPGPWPPERIDLAGKSIYFIIVDRFARDGIDAGNFDYCDYQTPHDFVNDGVDFSQQGGVLFGPRKAFGGRCNGTLQGLIDKISYVKGMGFDCIWINPVVVSTDYTGYSTEDFFSIDTHIGNPDILRTLVDTIHKNDMCVVLGIVLNHVRQMSYVWDPFNFKPDAGLAYIGPATVYPFNQPIHYHHYGAPPGFLNFEWYVMNGIPPAQVGDALGNSSVLQQHVKAGLVWCGPENPELTTCTCMPGNSGPHCPGDNPKLQVEGWFGSFADLNQSVPFVRRELLKYVRYLRDTYGVDAFRLDTAIYMPQDFLAEVQEVAGVDILGEATVNNLTYHASFQDKVLYGLLNFPAFYQVPQAFCQMRMEGDFGNYTLQGTFAKEAPNLTKLALVMQAQQRPGVYKNPDLLGNFVDNHDEFARIMHYCKKDQFRIQNALVWLMMSRGTPIIYYGTEQGLTGHQRDQFQRERPLKADNVSHPRLYAQFSSQALLRESLWQTRYNTSTWQYRLIGSLNGIRKRLNTTVGVQKFLFASESQIVFTRMSNTNGKDVWVFINNIPQIRSSEPVTYCPGPPGVGKIWKDAISGINATLKDGCLIAVDSRPQILEEV